MNFDKEHIFITGANGGIGEAIAIKFLEQGAAKLVTLHYNKNSSTVQQLLQKYGSERVQLVHADATSEEQVVAAVQQATKKQPINIMILNHGIYTAEHVELADMSLAQWNNSLNVNLTGLYKNCKM